MKFDEAITEFKKFLDSKSGSKEEREDAKRFIKNWEEGKELLKNPVDVTIDNIGAPVNTDNFEYVPLITSDESTMLITYPGVKSIGGLQPLADESGVPIQQFAEDILITHRDSMGKWTEPQLMGEQINTEGNDACVAFANDGRSEKRIAGGDPSLEKAVEILLEALAKRPAGDPPRPTPPNLAR